MRRIHNLRNRMREICSSGSVGERGGNNPLYPENLFTIDMIYDLRMTD